MKLFLSLVILGVVAFCAVRIGPVCIENYELQGYISQVAVQAAAHSEQAKPEVIQKEILTRAASLGLPVERQNINVVSAGKTVTIKLNYSVYVDLRFYVLPLHFTPTAHSGKIA